MVEEALIHMDEKIFKELMTTKKTMLKQNYPYKIKEEFISRDNPFRPIISLGSFLNLDCETHILDN